jgi:Tfp pilus assembly protein PilX
MINRVARILIKAIKKEKKWCRSMANVFICLLFTLGILAGCAVAPVQEMSDARQAIEAARSAGAERNAVEALNNAKALLTDAEKDLEDGNYKRARNNAAAAKAAAIKAREEAINSPDKLD